MVTKIKPYNPSASDLVSDWHVIDASDKVLGRLASEAATLLMGKHRPEYVPHMLSGDFVIITNAAAVKVTGNKADQIVYKRHSQKPGKLKEIPFKKVQAKFPARVIEHAVRGMLPKNKLGERMIRRLKVYAGEEHPHESQLAWSEGRPERDAAAAVKAEEEAKRRAEMRVKALARREIAADAAAKAPAPKAESKEPVTEEKPEVVVDQVTTPEVEAEVAEPAVAEKKAPAKKPAAKRASTAKASTTKAASTTTRKKPAAKRASTAKASTAKKAPATRKSPATKKADTK
jgi:large subunit ribosomal protein L13